MRCTQTLSPRQCGFAWAPSRESQRVRAPSLAFLLALTVCFSGLGTNGLAGSAPEPLQKQVDLDAFGVHLGEALQQLTVRTRVDFMAGTDVARPEEFERFPLYLELRGLSARQCSDWIARAYGTRYRVTHAGRAVTFTSAYDLSELPIPERRFFNLGGVFREEGGQREFLETLAELFKIQALLQPGTVLRIRATDQRLHAELPPALLERLQATLAAMGSTPKSPRSTESSPQDSIVRTLRRHLLRRIHADYEKWSAPSVLADLSFQTGLNIGFDHLLIRKGELDSVTLQLGETTLGAALERLGAQTGLQRILLDPGAGLWLAPAGTTGYRAAGREILWEDVRVESFSVEALARRTGVEELEEAVRALFPPDVRADPSAAASYFPPKGALIVIAPDYVLSAVEQVLVRLEQEHLHKED